MTDHCRSCTVCKQSLSTHRCDYANARPASTLAKVPPIRIRFSTQNASSSGLASTQHVIMLCISIHSVHVNVYNIYIYIYIHTLAYVLELVATLTSARSSIQS